MNRWTPTAEGKSFEFGMKKQFDSGLLASLALFRTEQQNLQEFVDAYSLGDESKSFTGGTRKAEADAPSLV